MPPYKIKSSQLGWFHQGYQEDGSQAAALVETLEGKLAARMALGLDVPEMTLSVAILLSHVFVYIC